MSSTAAPKPGQIVLYPQTCAATQLSPAATLWTAEYDGATTSGFDTPQEAIAYVTQARARVRELAPLATIAAWRDIND